MLRVDNVATLADFRRQSGLPIAASEMLLGRHYISSALSTAKRFNEAIREHWGIENRLHWTLDVAFNEDNSTKRADNAAENFSVITKIALNAVKQSELKKGVTKLSVKSKRKKAGWSNEYLTAILINAQ